AFIVLVTHPFLYHRAASSADAADQLAQAGAVSLGGGTDLLVTIGEELTRPAVLVDLRGIAENIGIRELAGGAVRIGGATPIADVAANSLVRERFPALA